MIKDMRKKNNILELLFDEIIMATGFKVFTLEQADKYFNDYFGNSYISISYDEPNKCYIVTIKLGDTNESK